MSKTFRQIQCIHSGYTKIQIYPTPATYRGQKDKGTTSADKLAAIAKNNDKIARRNFICYVLENFTPDDYCVTLTFPSEMQDMERYREAQRCIERLKNLYKKYESELKFIYVWGRGEQEGMLHCHMLINNDASIAYKVILASANKYNKKTHKSEHHFHIQRIGQKYTGRSKAETMKSTCYYLIKHWDTINPKDDELIKRRWYKSNNITRPLVSRYSERFGEADSLSMSPSEMMKILFRARRNGNLQETIEKLFPEYKLLPNSQINFYHDKMDFWRFDAELIRKGSPLDETAKKQKTDDIERLP